MRKCLAEIDSVMPIQEIKVDEKLNFIEEPEAIIDRKILKLISKKIGLVKV